MKMPTGKKLPKGSRTAAIVIFVVLALFLVIYTIYVFEAFKNNWIPFGKWDPTKDQLPLDAIIPRATTSDNIDSDITPEELITRVTRILTQNKSWYDSSSKCGAGTNCAIRLAGGQKVLAPSG
jgi:hypothetical protein